MSLRNWLYTRFALWSFGSKKRGKPLPRRPRRWSGRSHPWLEVLEDRLAPDSGGAAGVLTAAGNVVLNPNNLNTSGFTQVIPNVKIQLIFLTDPNGGNPLSVPAATQTAIKSFFTTITSDQYLPNLLSQYGGVLGLPAIGTGSVGVVDTSASVNADTTLSGHRAYSSGNLTSIIQAEINNHDSAPSDGLDNLYFLFTPPTDAVVSGSTNSIQDFAGYHSSFLDSGTLKRDYYAIIPDESSVNLNLFGAGNTNALRGETVAASHEMSEAITDAVIPRGWTNPTLFGAGEIGDLAAVEVYVNDGHEVQYEWSNAIVGPAHAPSSGPADLFINQLTPPAVPVSTSTSIPVATFTTANTSLTAGSFSALVFNYDSTGHGHVNWTVTSITGGNGHFVVNAKPNSAVTAGTYGLTFAEGQGLYVDVLDDNSADASAADGGIPISQRYAPYVVAAASPLTYTTDAGTHNLVLKENGANFELRDNGNLVFTQPVALTTSIVINGDGDPAGVDNSLTLDYSGGVFNTLPVLFDGGNGSGNHKVTVVGAALTALTYDATAAGAGDFVVNGNTTNKIAFTHVQTTMDSATTGNVTLNVDPNHTLSGLVNTTFAGSGANSTATLDNSLASFTFGNPTAALVVTGHTGNDNVTFTSLGSGFNAALTVAGNGGTDTVDMNTSLGLGSGTSSGNVSITASTINLNAAFAVQVGGATAGNGSNHYGQLNVTGTVAIGSGVALNLSALGGFVPAAGESFTIINNTGAGALSGTFSGLGEGATISNFLGSGLNAVITYAGGPNHNDVILTVPGSTQTTLTSLRSSVNPSQFGQSVTFTATVTSSGATPTGTVTFRDGTAILGTGTLNSSGVASFTTSSLSVASHSITAAYTASSNFLGSTSQVLTQVVNKASTSATLTSSVNPSQFGQSVTFTATVTSSGATPTGTVTFRDGTAILGTGTLNSSGVASFTTSSLSIATHSITVAYAVNSNFLGSTSPILTQVVNKTSTKQP